MTQVRSEVLLVSDLFFKGRFVVPWHQRYYDWSKELVRELLVDIKEAIDEQRSSYFLGSIMLVEHDDYWEINDGQQRLITLSLLFAALRRRFAGWQGTASALDAICLRILFERTENEVPNLDDTSRDTPRIDPPRQDLSRFTQIIRGHDIGMDGKLTSAWNEISLFVGAMNKREIRAFFEFLVQKVEIAVLYVPRTEDANAIFEALNGRGKQLDDLDLIRNHLYSYFSDPDDQVRRKTVHEALESALEITRGRTRTPERSQEYFRCFFQCKYGFLQKTRFYRDTRAKIRAGAARQRRDSNYVYDLVHSLTEPASVELFRTMTASNPNAELLDAFLRASRTGPNKRNLAMFLWELRYYKVTHPLIFAMLRRFVHEQDGHRRRRLASAVHRCTSNLASFVMRVSFCAPKVEPSKFEAAFANCAHRIASGSGVEDLDIYKELKECDDLLVMDDRRFIDQMSGIQMNDLRRAKRYLFGIYAHKQGDASVLNIEGCTVEHILPQSETHWTDWNGFAAARPDLVEWVRRTGNLTLMGKGDNHPGRGFNASFAAKKMAFEASSFQMTRDLLQYDAWNPDVIHERSKMLAKAAVDVWSFYAPAKK